MVFSFAVNPQNDNHNCSRRQPFATSFIVCGENKALKFECTIFRPLLKSV